MVNDNPFRPARVIIEYVDSVAGSQKTLSAIRVAVDRATTGVKTMFAMPTLDLIDEIVKFARQHGNVPVLTITSRNEDHTPARSVLQRLMNHLMDTSRSGHVLFVTHAGIDLLAGSWLREAADLMPAEWLPQAAEWEIVIDEAPEVILTRSPFNLRYSYYNLTQWLEIEPAPRSPIQRNAKNSFTDRDARILAGMEALLRPSSNAATGEREFAKTRAEELRAKKRKSESDEDQNPAYYMVGPKQDDWDSVERRVYGQDKDDIYRYLDPIPHWLLQGHPLFTDSYAWERMCRRSDFRYDQGTITISGFRRPDYLAIFKRVTMMSALFLHTGTYQVWSALDVNFVPSTLINININVTQLGQRRLRIFWLDDQGWSKKRRDKAGGIGPIFDLIRQSGIIDTGQRVCVAANKDNEKEILDFFPNAIVMPHNSSGQNRFRYYHQMIHTAALNSYTPDIRFIETVLGIDDVAQRISRTGQAIYQTMMRLSLREPTSTDDITLVIMDKDIADWLVQWFEPRDQVEVIQLDASGVIHRKGRAGRPRIDKPLSAAERMRNTRRRRKGDQP